MKTIVITLVLLGLFRAEAAPAPAQSVPEIEALRGPYQRNLDAIESARKTRTAPVIHAYIAELERLQKEITSSGDLDGALQVKAERQRVESGTDPTTVERKSMSAPLASLRARFEKEIQPILAALRTAEEQQKHDYTAALESLQRRLTVQNQLEKAALVRTERESISGAPPEKAAPIPAAVPGGAPPAPLSPSAVAGAGQLDPAFAEKIAVAIRDNKLALTPPSLENKPEGGHETLSEGAVLVGFEFMEEKDHGLPDVRSLRPIYLTTAGVKEGTARGKMDKITNKVLARSGYAVGGILAYHIDGGCIQGIQVIFMKMLPGEARLDQSSSNTYRSLWFGSRPRKEKPKELGGDGRPVVGVYGMRGANCDIIGLIQTSN